MPALCQRRERAFLKPAPDAIARVRDETVTPVAQRTGNPPERGGDSGPGAWQLCEQRERRIRSDKNLLRRTASVAHDDDRAGTERGRKTVMAREEFGYLQRLGGCETQAVATIATQKPPHRAVATSAAAIEDDQQTPAELRKAFHCEGDARAEYRIQLGGCARALSSGSV